MSKPPARSRPVRSGATITALTAAAAIASAATIAAAAVPAQATPVPAQAAKAPAKTSVKAPAKRPAPAILNAISCVSAKDCVAVGATTPNGNSNLVAGRWDGTRWHRLSVPEPGGVINKALTAVDCPAAKMCLAVGADDNAKTNMGAAVGAVWNGIRWSASDPPDWGDPLTTTTAINSVSCGSPTACAVAGMFLAAGASPARSATTGSATTGGATKAPIAEFWGPRATTHTPVTEPGWTGAYFDGVSCQAADRCVAVGAYEESRRTYTLVETLTGGKWQFNTSARPVPGRLKAVSCATATTCVAVGQNAANGGKPLVERSADGLREWTRSSAPLPKHVSWASLDTVSCASAASCLAGGESGRGNTAFVDTLSATRAKVLVSSGRAWPVHIMNGISCWSATACAVLGRSVPYTGASRSPLTRSVTAFLSAGKWKIVKTP